MPAEVNNFFSYEAPKRAADFLRDVTIRFSCFGVPRVQFRSATLINVLGGGEARASEPLDRQVKVAKNELHTSSESQDGTRLTA